MTIVVHILAEPFYMRQATGIYTAVRQLAAALEDREGVRLTPNMGAGPDVVHAHTVGPRYLLATFRSRERLIVSAHVTPSTCLGGVRFGRLCYAFTRRYLKFAYNRAQAVLAVSQAVRDELTALGVRSEIVVLPNSVDRALFLQGRRWRRAYREQLGIPEDAFVVLGVGQVQPRKGVQTFARVAEMLPDLRFVWVGGRPFGVATADYPALTRLQENPPANLTFAGLVALEEMPRYYGLADALLFPSHQETFGLAVLEAAAAQLPLVLRDTPEFKGHFYHHFIGQSDEEGFARALRQLQSDHEFYAHWRSEAAQLATGYELQSYMDRLMAIYRSVAHQRPLLTAQV